MIDAATDRHETFIEVTDGYRLWAETIGDPELPPLLLIMGPTPPALAGRMRCSSGWPRITA